METLKREIVITPIELSHHPELVAEAFLVMSVEDMTTMINHLPSAIKEMYRSPGNFDLQLSYLGNITLDAQHIIATLNDYVAEPNPTPIEEK